MSKLFSMVYRIRCLYLPFMNRWKFTLKGVSYGKNLRVMNYMYLQMGIRSRCEIGDNFTFTSGDAINPLCRNIRGCISVRNDAILKIGNNVGVSSPCIWVHKKVTIGNNVKIGGDCLLFDSDAHSLNYLDRREDMRDLNNKKDREIIIGDDVLIGARCIILKGAIIGDRAVIGAGSVVTQSIPPDCIAVGNPCKVVKYQGLNNEIEMSLY